MSAGARRLVDHPHSRLLELADAGLDVLDGVGDVVQPLAFLVDESRDRTRGVGRLEQFEADVADPEEADPDFLVGDVLNALIHSPESLLVERTLGVDRTDGNSNVIDGFDGFHDRSWLYGPARRTRNAGPGIGRRAALWPDRASFELDENLPLLDGVAHVDIDLGDLAGNGRRDHGFHLHGLEDQKDIIDQDGLPGLGRDLSYGAGEGAATDLGLVGHRSSATRGWSRGLGDGRGGRNARLPGRR